MAGDRTNSFDVPGPVYQALEAPDQAPLKVLLSDTDQGRPLGDVAMVRMWSNIHAQSHTYQRQGSLLRRYAGESLFWRQVAGATAVAIALTLALFLYQTPSPLTLERAGSAQGLTEQLVPSKRAHAIEFNDGSSMRLEAKAELSVLNNDGRTFVTKLQEGKVRFHIQPGGPRRWLIDAGIVDVEVVGTRFTVARRGNTVRVSVERGVVIVRGQVPGGEVKLTKGQELTADASTAPPSTAVSSPPATPHSLAPSHGADSSSALLLPGGFAPFGVGIPAKESETPSSSLGHEERSLTLADLPTMDGDENEMDTPRARPSQRKKEQTPREPPAVPTKSPSAPQARTDISQILLHADLARRQGNQNKAAELFATVVNLAPKGDPRRGMAALSYARIENDPHAVLTILQQGLSTMPPSLREPALARIVRAQQQTGDMIGAQHSAHLYLSEFSDGPRRGMVKAWAALP